VSATLEDALEVAADAWSDGAGAKVMTSMATKCVTMVDPRARLDLLSEQTAWTLLSALHRNGLSAKSVASYYGAFRRMLSLNGFETPTWPKALAPPRKAREVPSEATIEAAISWLRIKGWHETADLAHLIHQTGLRTTVEALRPGALSLTVGRATAEGDSAPYDVLTVAYGSGREIPVTDLEARAILQDPERMEAIWTASHSGHLQRLRKAAAAAGVPFSVIEPRALREAFRQRVLAASGGNVALVAELMGRSIG